MSKVITMHSTGPGGVSKETLSKCPPASLEKPATITFERVLELAGELESTGPGERSKPDQAIGGKKNKHQKVLDAFQDLLYKIEKATKEGSK